MSGTLTVLTELNLNQKLDFAPSFVHFFETKERQDEFLRLKALLFGQKST